MHFVVRSAERRDLLALAGIIAAFREYQHDPVGALGVAELDRDGFGDRPEFRIFLAEECCDEKVVLGYVLYVDCYEPIDAAKSSYVADLFVTPAARRRGIARALLAAVAHESLTRGRSFVWWCVREDSLSAHQFYDRVGAVIWGVKVRALLGKRFAALAEEAAGHAGERL